MTADDKYEFKRRDQVAEDEQWQAYDGGQWLDYDDSLPMGSTPERWVRVRKVPTPRWTVGTDHVWVHLKEDGVSTGWFSDRQKGLAQRVADLLNEDEETT